MSKLLILLLALFMGMMPVKAQVVIDHFRADGTRYVCTVQEIMYDNFFHTARFAISATSNAAGQINYMLEVTYDEGMLHISQGDTLSLVQRGGHRIYLTADRDVTKADIVKRHYRTYNDYYITCHYPISIHDLRRLTDVKTTKISVQTDDFDFDRKMDKLQERIKRQFIALYNYIM